MNLLRTEYSSKKTEVDISEDGQLCAVACNGHLNVYNTVQNELIYNFNQGSDSTKILKISPSKKLVSWLQTNPNEVFLSFIEFKKSKVLHSSSSDYTNEFILWCPNGNSLAVFSSHSMFIDVWKVEDQSADIIATISGAKFNGHNCPIAQFSYDGEFFSTVSICSQGHAITIYITDNYAWNCVQKIFVKGCDDIGGLLWCRDSASVLVWQAKRQLQLQLWTLYGRHENKLIQKSENATCVCLSHCGRMAAVLTADGKLQIIDILTWQTGPMGVMIHTSILHKLSIRSAVKEPPNIKGQIAICEPIQSDFYELKQAPSLSRHKPFMKFSPNAEYLATFEPHYPSTLWIWNLITNPLLDTVIVLSDDTYIKGMLWHSKKTCLAASLTGNKVLVWTPQQSSVVTNKNHEWPFTAEFYFATVSVCNDNSLSLDD